MRGLESYKLRSATRIVPAADLSAWSSAPVSWAVELPAVVRARVRVVIAASPALRNAWLRVKRRVLLRQGPS